MIGILLALQVNTWNEGRKDRTKEKAILSELHREFSENLIEFYTVKQDQFNQFNSGKIVFRNLPKMHIPQSRDSVYKYVQGMFGGYSYHPSNGVTESLISSGDFNLIQNDTLRRYLVSWKDVLKNYTEHVNIDINLWSNMIEPYVISHGNFYKINSEENLQLIQDQVFINMLVRKQHFNKNIISVIEGEDSIERYMKEIVRLSEVKE